tara:strand:+ start:582 stop:1391 length:810 start_codon:yes stop_codon:yes gene_type:complete
MKIFKSINKLNKEVNFKANVGFVPTMGALHKGHISLINQSKVKCSKTLVSIFVNPSQFNKKKDLKDYPVQIKKDISILLKLKVDYVLLPNVKDIYDNRNQMRISIDKRDKVLCAYKRPGHFEGVLAVINQFLLKIKPKFIFLGEKDFQQIYLINKFIKKKFKTKIITCKTIREKSFLPFSSRNTLLSAKDFEKASSISIILKDFYFLVKRNFKNIKKINEIKKIIKSKKVNLEYLEIRNKNNFSKKVNSKNFKIFIAYYLKSVRLIDNF